MPKNLVSASQTEFQRGDGQLTATSQSPLLPITYPTGASNYYVWTTDASGNGSWQAPGGGGYGATAAGLGLALMTMNPAQIDAAQQIFGNYLHWAICTAVSAQTITTLGALLQTAGATPGAGINGMAIYTAATNITAATLLQQTADMTAVMSGAAGYIEGALAAPVTLAVGQNYYITATSNWTGAGMFFGAGASQLASYTGANIINGINLVAAKSAQTSFPATFTPSSSNQLIAVPMMYAR